VPGSVNWRPGVLRLFARARPAWADSPIVLNAASLFGSTAITSGLGFCFWLLAAHLFPVNAVGVASAAVSSMQLAAVAGLAGMGTLMIAELADGRAPAGLVSAAAICAGLTSAAVGLGYLLLESVASVDLGFADRGVWGPIVYLAGVAATSAAFVIDQASIGIQRGDLQLARNTVFSVVKLALLPAVVVLAARDAALGIYAAWFLGGVVSLLTLRAHLWRGGLRPQLRPAFRALGAIRGAALAHHWLNLSSQTPRLALPVLVATILSPSLTAAFYTAVLIVNFADVVPGHLSNALFALPRGQLDRLARELRGTLRISAVVAVFSAGLIAVSSHFILSLFGPEYVAATTAMIILGFATLPFSIKVHYMAVCRVHGRLRWCATITTIGAAMELGAAAIGAEAVGLWGVSAGLLLALSVEALLLWPSVARAAGLPRVLPWSPADGPGGA